MKIFTGLLLVAAVGFTDASFVRRDPFRQSDASGATPTPPTPTPAHGGASGRDDESSTDAAPTQLVPQEADDQQFMHEWRARFQNIQNMVFFAALQEANTDPQKLEKVDSVLSHFDMRNLLQDYFQVAKECGRFQMAQFIARYFLNHETGQVEFQHEAFRNMQTMTEPSPMQFRSEAENSRRMNAVIHATKMLHELRRRERRDEGAQMPDFDEQEFERRFTARLTTVTARLAVGGDYPVNELFAGVSRCALLAAAG